MSVYGSRWAALLVAATVRYAAVTSIDGRERSKPTAGLVSRAPDMASVVCHMSYCHEMSVCQICFLLLACGKLNIN